LEGIGGKKNKNKKNQPGTSVSPPSFESSVFLLQFTCVDEYQNYGFQKCEAVFYCRVLSAFVIHLPWKAVRVPHMMHFWVGTAFKHSILSVA